MRVKIIDLFCYCRRLSSHGPDLFLISCLHSGCLEEKGGEGGGERVKVTQTLIESRVIDNDIHASLVKR